MSGSLTPGALPAVASFIATTELHICASHPADDAIWDRRPNPNWDFEIRQSQAFLRQFGADHGVPFTVQIKPNNLTTWNVWMYTSQLDLAAVLRLASVSRAWVKPMHHVAQVFGYLQHF